ncbi:MAG: ferrous iron transport protein A [Verrucomicrobiales bacterium]|nr:ferrous iron transport protein A [Verrucomicrobiales bacterium]
MSDTTLADLPAGTAAVVHRFTTSRPSLTRLRELGLTPGTAVRVTRRAPLGEPIEIDLRGSRIAMRNADAAYVVVTRLD